MSSICIAGLSNFYEAEAILLCKQHLLREAAHHEMGVQFELDYEESFLDEISAHGDMVLCNFSDAQNTINCEKLLCPDGCNVDIWPDIGTLDYRIHKLVEMLRVAQKYASCVDLYFGDGGPLYEDFDHETCAISELQKYLVAKINEDPFLILHLSVT